jgi:hypothetical protein
MDKAEARNQLLLKMYDQMFNDINRHILVIWQSIGVVVGAFALFSLVEKQIIPIDFAAALLFLLCGWMLAQLYDSAYWYNRNLVIIANIEREFLEVADLRRIHYYFGAHRGNKMIFHLRIQRYLAWGLILLVLIFHFATRVIPGLHLPLSNFNLQRSVPYLSLLFIFPFVNYVRNARAEAYEEFLQNSPGKEMAPGDIQFGAGHGMDRGFFRILKLSFLFGWNNVTKPVGRRNSTKGPGESG